jgi:hypothetical protein
MSVEQAGPWPGSIVELHDVDSHGETGEAHSSIPAEAPDLVIIQGSFAHAAAREKAVSIARRQSDDAQLIAVFRVGVDTDHPSHDAHLRELHAAFHAVMVVTDVQRQRAVEGLLRTLLRRDGQDQWISCDWNDVRHMLGTCRGSLVRFGCGRGSGDGRAACATLDAVAQVDREGPGLRAARGICIGIRGATNTLYGSEIKEVMRQVRGRFSRDAAITMSIGCDRALEDGALEVDIFAFGAYSEAELATQGAGGDDAAPDAGSSQHTAWQGEDASLDPLYAAARSLVMQHQRASISLVQRHLRIGYGRAARLLDAMRGDVLIPEPFKP